MELPLSEEAREWLRKARALVVDEDGRETLIGLTRDETEEHYAFIHEAPTLWFGWDREERRAAGQRYLEFRARTERANIEALFAEADAQEAALKK